MRDISLKKRNDEKRRAERKQRHLQDDLRYALKKLPEPFDTSMSYEEVRALQTGDSIYTDVMQGDSVHARPARVQSDRR